MPLISFVYYILFHFSILYTFFPPRELQDEHVLLLLLLLLLINTSFDVLFSIGFSLQHLLIPDEPY